MSLYFIFGLLTLYMFVCIGFFLHANYSLQLDRLNAFHREASRTNEKK